MGLREARKHRPLLKKVVEKSSTNERPNGWKKPDGLSLIQRSHKKNSWLAEQLGLDQSIETNKTNLGTQKKRIQRQKQTKESWRQDNLMLS